MTPEQVDQVRTLNDLFRTNPHSEGGRTLITQGVSAKGLIFSIKAHRAVQEFKDFTQGNDPYAEHDFGCATFRDAGEDHRVFWKIDYYASGDMDFGSEAPWDADLTTRVLTIMLPEEY